MIKYDKYKSSDIKWLGNIPFNWVTKRTKDVIKSFVGGGTPSTDKLEYWDGLIPWVSAKDMKFDKISETIDYVTELGIKESSTKLIKSNSILFVARSGILKHTFPVAINIVPLAINQDLKAIEPNKLVSVDFLACSFKGLSSKILMQCQKVGATVDSIEIQEFLNFQIALPPLLEQTSIAQYLNAKTQAIDKKINLLTKKAETYKELRKSIINDAVTKGLNFDCADLRITMISNQENQNNPKNHGSDNVKLKESEFIFPVNTNWKRYRLKDLGFLYSGLSGKAGDDFNQDDNPNNKGFIPFTNIANNTYLKANHLGTVALGKNEKQNKVRKGDLFFLMSSEGYEDVGKTAALAEDINDTYLNSFCKGYRITKNFCEPFFLNYLLLSDNYRKSLITEGKGFTRINLKMEKVTDFFVYLPPTKEEQTAIANYLDEKTQKIDAIVTNIGKQIDTLKELRKTLINDVVTGKIKVSEL